MKITKREDAKRRPLPGRIINLVVGQDDAVSPSDVMTMGFARYSEESGPMDPHHHVEEIVYVMSATDGYLRHGGFGDEPNELGDRIPLSAGDILHVPAYEWHVFEFDAGGHVDIIFFYSASDVYSNQ
jgi:hypothetical protein